MNSCASSTMSVNSSRFRLRSVSAKSVKTLVRSVAGKALVSVVAGVDVVDTTSAIASLCDPDKSRSPLCPPKITHECPDGVLPSPLTSVLTTYRWDRSRARVIYVQVNPPQLASRDSTCRIPSCREWQCACPVRILLCRDSSLSGCAILLVREILMCDVSCPEDELIVRDARD